MNDLTTLIVHRVSTTDTTVADDFLNLYPEDVPDNMGSLVDTGFGFRPFLFAAIVLAALGASLLGAKRRRA
jgi:hypothetical protein